MQQTLLTLTDITNPIPDWPLLLITSDNYEDNDNLLLANTLRWMAKNQHWPTFSKTCWRWWISLKDNYYLVDRYSSSKENFEEIEITHLESYYLYSTLPPTKTFINEPSGFYSFADAIVWLSSSYLPSIPYNRLTQEILWPI